MFPKTYRGFKKWLEIGVKVTGSLSTILSV